MSRSISSTRSTIDRPIAGRLPKPPLPETLDKPAGDKSEGAPYEYRIQVLDRAIQILDNLEADRSGLGLSELAAKLGMHKSTLHRLIMVLESKRFIEREPDSGKYRLGPRLTQLGMSALARRDLYSAARPFMTSLVEKTGETAHMGVLREGEVVSLFNVESSQNLRTPVTVGARSPVHCSSLGKAMLAFLPPLEIEAFLRGRTFRAYTPHTITGGLRLKEDLRAIRRRGYSIDNEEREEGLRCIGAPVYDATGEVVAAVSIAGPGFRVTEGRVPEIGRAVCDAAALISANLGYNSIEHSPIEYPRARRRD
jgi:IclR family KDG regulon transcriptional repressor